MYIWISTVNATSDLDAGFFKNHKGVVVNVVTYAKDKDSAIRNIIQELDEYHLQVKSIDDLEILQNNNLLQSKNLRKLAKKSQRDFTTELDTFYTYDE